MENRLIKILNFLIKFSKNYYGDHLQRFSSKKKEWVKSLYHKLCRHKKCCLCIYNVVDEMHLRADIYVYNLKMNVEEEYGCPSPSLQRQKQQMGSQRGGGGGEARLCRIEMQIPFSNSQYPFVLLLFPLSHVSVSIYTYNINIYHTRCTERMKRSRVRASLRFAFSLPFFL